MRICFMATCSLDGNFPEQQGKTTANKKIKQKKVSVSGVPQHFNIHLFHVKNALGEHNEIRD